MTRETNYDHCYQTLDLKPGASLTEIKQRYRELARRWHPDTVSPAQRDFATYQFQQINAAKDILESYWEQYNCAPPSERQQRFEEAIQRHNTRQRQRTTSARTSPSEGPPQAQSRQFYDADSPHEIWQQQQQRPRQVRSSVTFLDRIFIVFIAEASIFLILWFGYHGLMDLHTSMLNLQIHSPNDLILNVFFGLFVMALLIGGYLTGIVLILLAFLFLFVPHEEIQRISSRRRKPPVNPFPHLSRPFPSRQKW